MEETLVSFEVAKLLKENGFNESCPYYYVQEFGNSEYLKNLHGTIIECKTTNEHGDVIGYYKRKNSSGQPHIIIAPTQSLAQKWIREVHGIFLTVECDSAGHFRYHAYNLDAYNSKYPKYLGIEDTGLFEFGNDIYEYNTYEEALEEGIKQALQLINN